MPFKAQDSVLEKTTAGFLLSFRKSVISVSGFLVTSGVFATASPHLTGHRMINNSVLPILKSCRTCDW